MPTIVASAISANANPLQGVSQAPYSADVDAVRIRDMTAVRGEAHDMHHIGATLLRTLFSCYGSRAGGFRFEVKVFDNHSHLQLNMAIAPPYSIANENDCQILSLRI